MIEVTTKAQAMAVILVSKHLKCNKHDVELIDEADNNLFIMRYLGKEYEVLGSLKEQDTAEYTFYDLIDDKCKVFTYRIPKNTIKGA